MTTKIEDVAVALPSRCVSNENLVRDYPSWAGVADKIGVECRYVVEDDETALDLAFRAASKLLSVEGRRKKIDALIMCTQTSDYLVPHNSAILQSRLGLHTNIFTLDINLACSGYVQGLVLADSLIKSGAASNVMLVTGDTYSKHIYENDKSVRLLFGDAASATFLVKDEHSGLLDFMSETHGSQFDQFIIPVGGSRNPKGSVDEEVVDDIFGNPRSNHHINMSGFGILEFAADVIPKQIKALLERNSLTLARDIDLVISHQASLLALHRLKKSLLIPDDKFFINIGRYGNTVSSSIPLALFDAKSEGLFGRGDLILMVGFGAGFSSTVCVIKY